VQRVAILGAGGAGKSQLARELATRTGLRIVHLDVLYWRPGWTPPPPDDFRAVLAEAVAEERWILDGNFLRYSGDPRFARADTVVFLDLPRTTCLRRAVWRALRDRRRARGDLPEGCPESLELSFLRWVWNYPRNNRPNVVARLAALDAGVAVHRLRSQADVRRFLAGV